MQSLLASYGSDSEDEGTPASATTTASAASGSKPAPQLVAEQPAASPALTAAVQRVKGTTSSRGPSPLSGVKLASTSASPAPPSSNKLGKRRESSASPPRFQQTQRPASPYQRDEDERNGEQGITIRGRASSSRVQLDALCEFGIPPVPTGPCKPSVEAKLANFHKLRETRGLHFNDSLHASKAFRNPRIYAKLVEFVDVDETGTNWDRQVWDPKGLGPEATASRIAELQKIRSEAKAAQPAGSRSSIAFTSSSSSASTSRRDDRDRDRGDRDRERDRRDRDRGGGGGGGGGERKKSRWDRDARDRSRSPRRR
ncbi:hypothetical protein JCM8097_002522 [Rhodosporidiobolus ruineniae]